MQVLSNEDSLSGDESWSGSSSMIESDGGAGMQATWAVCLHCSAPNIASAGICAVCRGELWSDSDEVLENSSLECEELSEDESLEPDDLGYVTVCQKLRDVAQKSLIRSSLRRWQEYCSQTMPVPDAENDVFGEMFYKFEMLHKLRHNLECSHRRAMNIAFKKLKEVGSLGNTTEILHKLRHNFERSHRSSLNFAFDKLKKHGILNYESEVLHKLRHNLERSHRASLNIAFKKFIKNRTTDLNKYVLLWIRKCLQGSCCVKMSFAFRRIRSQSKVRHRCRTALIATSKKVNAFNIRRCFIHWKRQLQCIASLQQVLKKYIMLPNLRKGFNQIVLYRWNSYIQDYKLRTTCNLWVRVSRRRMKCVLDRWKRVSKSHENLRFLCNLMCRRQEMWDKRQGFTIIRYVAFENSKKQAALRKWMLQIRLGMLQHGLDEWKRLCWLKRKFTKLFNRIGYVQRGGMLQRGWRRLCETRERQRVFILCRFWQTFSKNHEVSVRSAFKLWLCKTEEYKLFCATVKRRVIAKLRLVSLRRAWWKWRGHTKWVRYKVLAMFLRSKNKTTAVLGHWFKKWKAREALVSRRQGSLQRLFVGNCRRVLSSGFNSWRLAVMRKTKFQVAVSRISLQKSKRDVQDAFAIWRLITLRIGRLQVAVRKVFLRTSKGVLVDGFDCWKRYFTRSKIAAKVILRMLNSETRRDIHRSFTCWKNQIKTQKLILRVFQAKRRRDIKTSFSLWKTTCRTLNDVKCVLSRHLRWTARWNLNSAFSKWKLVISVSEREILKEKTRQLCLRYSFFEPLNHGMSQCSLMNAYNTWKRHTERERALYNAVCKMKTAVLSAGWRTWKERHGRYSVGIRVVSFWVKASLYAAWQTWKSMYSVSTLMGRLIANIDKAQNVSSDKGKYRAFVQWKKAVYEGKRTDTMYSFLESTSKRNMLKLVWHAWRNVCILESRPRLRQQKIMEMLNWWRVFKTRVASRRITRKRKCFSRWKNYFQNLKQTLSRLCDFMCKARVENCFEKWAAKRTKAISRFCSAYAKRILRKWLRKWQIDTVTGKRLEIFKVFSTLCLRKHQRLKSYAFRRWTYKRKCYLNAIERVIASSKHGHIVRKGFNAWKVLVKERQICVQKGRAIKSDQLEKRNRKMGRVFSTWKHFVWDQKTKERQTRCVFHSWRLQALALNAQVVTLKQRVFIAMKFHVQRRRRVRHTLVRLWYATRQRQGFSKWRHFVYSEKLNACLEAMREDVFSVKEVFNKAQGSFHKTQVEMKTKLFHTFLRTQLYRMKCSGFLRWFSKTQRARAIDRAKVYRTKFVRARDIITQSRIQHAGVILRNLLHSSELGKKKFAFLKLVNLNQSHNVAQLGLCYEKCKRAAVKRMVDIWRRKQLCIFFRRLCVRSTIRGLGNFKRKNVAMKFFVHMRTHLAQRHQIGAAHVKGNSIRLLRTLRRWKTVVRKRLAITRALKSVSQHKKQCAFTKWQRFYVSIRARFKVSGCYKLLQCFQSKENARLAFAFRRICTKGLLNQQHIRLTKNIAQRWSTKNMLAAFQVWKKSSFISCRQQSLLRHVLNSWHKRTQRWAVNRWRKQAWLNKRTAKLMLKFARGKASCAFNKWKRHWIFCQDRGPKLKCILLSTREKYLGRSFQRWQDYSMAYDKTLRKVLLSWTHRKLSQAFRRMHESSLCTKRVVIIGRVMRDWRFRRLAMAFSQLQMATKVCTMQLNSTRQIVGHMLNRNLRTAFSQWVAIVRCKQLEDCRLQLFLKNWAKLRLKCAFNCLRVFSKKCQVYSRVLNRWRRRCLVQGFATWKQFLFSSTLQHFKHSNIKGVIRRMQQYNKRAAFRHWAAKCADFSHKAALVRNLAKRCLFRWKVRELADAFSTWRGQYYRISVATAQVRCMLRIIAKMRNYNVAMAFRKWKGCTKEATLMLSKCVMMFKQVSLHKCLRSWKAYHSERRFLKHIIFAWETRYLFSAFCKWKIEMSTTKQMQATMRRVYFNWKHRQLANGFKKWKVEVSRKNQAHSTMRRVYIAFSKRRLLCAFNSLKTLVKRSKRAQLVRRILHRWAKLRLASGIQSWKLSTQQDIEQKRFSRLVRRLLYKEQLRSAFQRWRYLDLKKRKFTRIVSMWRKIIKRNAFMRWVRCDNWLASLRKFTIKWMCVHQLRVAFSKWVVYGDNKNKSHQRVVRDAFHEWSRKTARKVRQKYYLRTLIGRCRATRLSVSFRVWLRRVMAGSRDDYLLRRICVQWKRCLQRSGLNEWKAYLQRFGKARQILERLVLNQTFKVRLAMQTWKQFRVLDVTKNVLMYRVVFACVKRLQQDAFKVWKGAICFEQSRTASLHNILRSWQRRMISLAFRRLYQRSAFHVKRSLLLKSSLRMVSNQNQFIVKVALQRLRRQSRLHKQIKLVVTRLLRRKLLLGFRLWVIKDRRQKSKLLAFRDRTLTKQLLRQTQLCMWFSLWKRSALRTRVARTCQTSANRLAVQFALNIWRVSGKSRRINELQDKIRSVGVSRYNDVLVRKHFNAWTIIAQKEHRSRLLVRALLELESYWKRYLELHAFSQWKACCLRMELAGFRKSRRDAAGSIRAIKNEARRHLLDLSVSRRSSVFSSPKLN